MPSNESYLTIAEAAARMAVSESTIRRWTATGRLRSRRFGKQQLVLRTSVESETNRLTHPTPSSGLSRRAFLALGKAVAIGSSGWIFVLYQKLEKIRSSPVEVSDLFPRWPDIQVVPGSHHPVDGFHPDIQIALERLAPLVPRVDPVVIAGADALPPADLARDLVLIGGPISNSISLDLHGYQYDRDKISVQPVRNTGLRWCFYYPNQCDDDPQFRRYVAGKLRATKPKALMDRCASGMLSQPRFSAVERGTDRIQSDYLLVTVVPNTLARSATGSSIIDVADLCGQGDKTFGDLLRDADSRRELALAVKGRPYFQALYEVSVTHDDAKAETTPGAPRLVDVQVLV
jgi:excisionase family DNA binding protein